MAILLLVLADNELIFAEHLFYVQFCSQGFRVLIHLTSTQWESYSYLHFTDEEIEAGRG